MSHPLILDHFLPYRLSITSNLVSGAVADTYKALFGLTIPEWRLIALIAEREGITQQEIGALSRMDKVTVSRAAIALADRGLIERRPNPADKRSQLLALSEAGRHLYAAVTPKALEMEHALFGRFSDAELETFIAMLRRIDAAVLDSGPPSDGGGAI
ncbi:MarR family winged helix-turn-helix transcriptional regulator [Sphingomonas abietis]|uniref:MarR family transcriptional regulator n=1 Tax=Sphingomonas abietis TaxID=3012344 RepID=A0ABY7NRX6_9SPHN|nr:MarR family transcriptional regulator [Sphingomonas abietis]WBO22251.1 MarR family transcriptional regulator [Sphingomonas abietis]